MCKHYNKEVIDEKVKEHGKLVPGYEYKIFIYNKDGGAPTEQTIDFHGSFVHGATLLLNNDGNVTLLGLYTSLYHGNVTGHFMATFDKNTKLVNVKKMEQFPKGDFIKQMKKDDCASSQKKNYGLFKSFNIKGTNRRDDGSLDLIIEYGDSYMSAAHESFTSNWYTPYRIVKTQDIVVISYKKDGTIVYTRVPKSQNAGGDDYVSFKWMNQGNNLLLFYNDYKSNLDQKLSKSPIKVEDFNRTHFVMVVINEKGELQRKSVFRHRDKDVITKISACQHVSSNTFIICAERDSQPAKTRTLFGSLKFL
jgi:hypothetical protein